MRCQRQMYELNDVTMFNLRFTPIKYDSLYIKRQSCNQKAEYWSTGVLEYWKKQKKTKASASGERKIGKLSLLES